MLNEDHYCPDWDYMAIAKDSPEIEGCACNKEGHDIDREVQNIIKLALCFGEKIDGRFSFKINKLIAFADAITNEALSNTDEILRVIVENENYYDDLTNMLMVGCYTEAAAIFGKAASEI